jgi:hypothetical protein
MRREINTTEARAGIETGLVRWVLHISVALVVVAFVIIWLVAT